MDIENVRNFNKEIRWLLNSSRIDQRKLVNIALILLFYKIISIKIENLKNNVKEDKYFPEIAKSKLGYFIKKEHLFSSVINADYNPKETIHLMKEIFQGFAKSNDNIADIFSHTDDLFDVLAIEHDTYELLQLINKENIDAENFYDFWKISIDLDIFPACPTNLHISELISKIVKLYAKDMTSVKICDTTCGTGILLAEACRRILDNNCVENINCEASDISNDCCLLTKMTMIIAGIDAKIKNEDILLKNKAVSSDMDFVIAEIPMHTRWNQDYDPTDDPRFQNYVSDIPLATDWMFLLHNLFCTNKNGCSILIMDYMQLNSPGSIAISLREKLINDNIIEAVIKLDNKQCIVILKQKKNNNSILLIDTSNEKGGTIDIDKIIDTLKNKKSIRGFSKSASAIQIEKNSYLLNVSRYTDPIVDILKSEDTVNLSDYVDIYSPFNKSKIYQTGKILQAKDMKYPIDYENMDIGQGSNIEIHKGDIIFDRKGHHGAFLVNTEPFEKVLSVCDNTYYILRLKENIKNVSPEYICMYLNSDIGKKIINIYTDGTILNRIYKTEIGTLKIIKPRESADYYAAMFDYQISPYNHNKQLIDLTMEHKEDKNIEAFFISEQIEKMWQCHDNEVQEIIKNDLAEVQNCIRVKAYKAALILCGAILEGFLVDWLNEKDPKGDWLTIHDDDKSGKYNLRNYISCIKEIRKPYWMESAIKADRIRKKRNLVHATLCLANDEPINEDLCLEVLKYLQDIIATRWKK